MRRETVRRYLILFTVLIMLLPHAAAPSVQAASTTYVRLEWTPYSGGSIAATFCMVAKSHFMLWAAGNYPTAWFESFPAEMGEVNGCHRRVPVVEVNHPGELVTIGIAGADDKDGGGVSEHVFEIRYLGSGQIECTVVEVTAPEQSRPLRPIPDYSCRYWDR